MSRRNPNHYGCVTHLKGKRKRPWIVKVTVYDMNGCSRQKPIGYADTKENALILLAQYNQDAWEINRETITINDVFWKWKEVKATDLSKGNQQKLKSAFKWCQPCYGMKYRSIKSYHMQRCIDECPKGYQTKAAIQTLFGHLDRFAFELDIITKMYSQIITIHDAAPETTRTPFTADQITAMWKSADQRPVMIVLVFIYSGFRKMELVNMKTNQVDLKNQTFTGGEKTAAGKNRVVPIHPRILPFITKLVNDGRPYLLHSETGAKYTHANIYTDVWRPAMEILGIKGKTLHETRHTFETMLDNAGGNRKCIDMLMGHVSTGVGNRVYNHKTLDQLRDTIALLK